jgi:quinol monooxygenase YgiN
MPALSSLRDQTAKGESMSNQSLRVVARVKAKPDTVREVRELLTGLIEPTRVEAGCVSYELLQNTQDPTDFTFVEEWEDDASFQGHFSTDHITRTLPKLQEVAAEPPDIRTYALVR